MCKDDIDLREIVMKNREKIEEILGSLGDDAKMNEGPFDKAGDVVKSAISILLDPKVQMHFVRAGKEFFSGVEAMIKEVPLPDEVKAAVDKACEVKNIFVKNIVNEAGSDAKPESKGTDGEKKKDKKMKKIDVE